MEASIECLVQKIKQELFSSSFATDLYSFLPPSAYDTAWVAMIPHLDDPHCPMFPQCLDWVLGNQNVGGFWGETEFPHCLPTLDCLTSTLASIAVLRKWDVGSSLEEHGLGFLRANTSKLLLKHQDHWPEWFVIVFPGMLDLAKAIGLEIFPRGHPDIVKDVYRKRELILGTKANSEEDFHLPLALYLEVLPMSCRPIHEAILAHQSSDGSLFQSPSATACAFMITKSRGFLDYLEAVVQRFGYGVPPEYPVHEDYIKLCLVDHLERLGCSEHFTKEIEDVMNHAYSNWDIGKSATTVVRKHNVPFQILKDSLAFTLLRKHGYDVSPIPPEYPEHEDYIKLCLVDHLERLGCSEHFTKEIEDVMNHAYSNWDIGTSATTVVRKHNVPFQLLKDSLAFTLLRKHGYNVSPRFCEFVQDEDLLLIIERNYTHFLGAMYSVYRASHYKFSREDELERACHFSKTILQKELSNKSVNDGGTNFQKEIDHELKLPWLARMDHLEHRMYIERHGACHFWIGKASPHRLPFSKNNTLFQLAVKSFIKRQSMYRDELEELKRWSRDLGLSCMGFGREKTSYLYYGVATTTCLPPTSDVRLVVAKCAILVTVADDFYDEKGSLDELHNLTKAVQSWSASGLFGHSKTIFNALDELVNDISIKAFSQHGHNIKEVLQNIWRETFESWLKEAEWSRRRYAPSIDEYLKVAMASIAIHTMVLPGCYLTEPKVPKDAMSSCYSLTTRLLMVCSRLMNDMESYQKEEHQGKLNMVLLYMKENPKASIEDSVAYIRKILDSKKEEFLELVLLNRCSDLPKEWRRLHLSFLKVFQMFFNSTNAFDSPTAVVPSINMAFYDPLVKHVQSSDLLESSLHLGDVKKKKASQSEHFRSSDDLSAKANCRLHLNHTASKPFGVASFNMKQSMSFFGSKASDVPIFLHNCSNASHPHKPLLWM